MPGRLAAAAIALPFALALPNHYLWELELIISERRAYDLLDAERLQGYGAAAGVLVPFHSLFDDWR
jgi:hypothetical protein